MTNMYDIMALRALLRGDQEEVNRCYALASATAGKRCPQCGERDIELHHNGFLCTGCDHQWTPDDLEHAETT